MWSFLMTLNAIACGLNVWTFSNTGHPINLISAIVSGFFTLFCIAMAAQNVP